MNLHLRAPHGEEWQLCRMLLPETFADAPSREYLLCLRDEEPRLVAAVSFRKDGNAAKKLRIHVVPGFRRRGIGSQVVASLLGGELRSLDGTVDTVKEPGAASFCERIGFRQVEQMFTVEGDVAEMQKHLHRLRARIQMPPKARLVRLPDAPFEQVARLHADEVAHSELNPWRALLGQMQGMALSPVVMVDDEVAGFLLMQIEGSIVSVHSRVIAPAYRGGWVLVVALSEALDVSWEEGCRVARFSYLDTNRDTERLAQRFHARTVSVATHFRREAEGAAASK
jgi:GNAT superfamily N-acetyltransferase